MLVKIWASVADNVILANGTPNDVREEVRQKVKDLASGGGYVFAHVHNIQANVPPENVIAFFDAAYEFGFLILI